MPTSLPFFALITDGLANVSDSGTFDTSFAGVAKQYTTSTLSPGASRSVAGNWTLKPTTNPDRLMAMRGAYHVALGVPVTPEEEAMIVRFLGTGGVGLIPARFVCSGGKRDVPKKDAVYIGCSNGTYIWVMPGKGEAFSQFTLIILRLYLNKLGGQDQNEIAATGDPQPNPFGPRPASPPIPAAQPYRVMSQDYPPSVINQGLFFIPR